MKLNPLFPVLSLALAASASAQAPALIARGNVLSWSSSSGNRGALRIAAVDGLYFEAEQTNESNRAAGVVRLYGAMVDNGHRMVLINTGQWKEVWEGTVFGNEITGRLSAGSADFTFRISAGAPPMPPMPLTAPFISGRTLRWTTEAAGGQNGTLYVASVQGPTFRLEQINAMNPGAGVTKLDGEIRDGRVFIYNRKWNETWIGTVDNGAVFGKVNNHTSFRIFE